MRGCGGARGLSGRPGGRRRAPVLVPSLVTLAVATVLVPVVLAVGVGVTHAGPAGAAAQAHVYDDGGMIGFGSANLDPTLPQPLDSPVFSGVATPDGAGYLLASADGGVFAFGDATFEGSAGALPLNGPIVAMATTPDAKGYWLGALDGGVFAYGDAPFYGSMGSTRLNQPIVGMAATPDGKGYWLVAADGGIFDYGDAGFYGSTGSIVLNAPIVGMAATPDGKGYWLVAADGGVFTFGDAAFDGSAGSANLPDPVVGMVASPDGGGYLLATENGVVLPYGDAQAFGGLSLDPTAAQISAIIGNNRGTGYWLLDPQAWQYSFMTPTPEPMFPQSAAIASAVASQIEPDPSSSQGAWCNPYGPCEEWCALFATWAWEQAGVPIPRYAFTGDIWDWAATWGADLPPTATPAVGDAVLYGTGPWSTATSVHVGIVTQVWPDGSIMTAGGDSGPGRDGYLSVALDGPFLPADSNSYNGVPIYGFAQP
ncbi:MAG: CHAP domain-containing protein [Acidimicrobiales bacterium]